MAFSLVGLFALAVTVSSSKATFAEATFAGPANPTFVTPLVSVRADRPITEARPFSRGHPITNIEYGRCRPAIPAPLNAKGGGESASKKGKM